MQFADRLITSWKDLRNIEYLFVIIEALGILEKQIEGFGSVLETNVEKHIPVLDVQLN